MVDVLGFECRKMSKSALPLKNMGGPEKQLIKKEALVKLLRWHFGHSDFRGNQLETIQAVLSGPCSLGISEVFTINVVCAMFNL